ncbi:hypothetical protein JDV02_004367 [Purpureocillium takamizusanense]|uniref:Ubiquitin-conjugating enzyme n=1 Tax=Purpureocillium takamizusanense TaxID=2060973 RepID=A0A9Q8QF31_9HYPO|nr:uncharacterized protein JDV02_004367 [Purpureocillium takamizusanense]UNI18072.1 hypothetical protein JDV02_004367 [Purpureocillium takamizusanense]
MRRLPYLPAHDPRHRAAALALYRALIRSARQVPLPKDLLHSQPAASSGSSTPSSRGGPIGEVVRRRVAGNRGYTSLRLVFASLAAGYRFLGVLARARDAASPENAQLVAHIRATAQRRDNDAAAAAESRSRRRGAPFVPEPLPEPLLVNVAPPGHPPEYVSSTLPRPRATLGGSSSAPRRVPSLCITSDGQPFLRISKPQPRALSRMVGRKGLFFQRHILKIVEIDEDLMPAAKLEDEWDGHVAKLMRLEGVTPVELEDANMPGGQYGASHGGTAKSVAADTSSYSWSVQITRLWWEWRIEQMWQDWTARGTALTRIVEEERALAEMERKDDRNNNNSVEDQSRQAAREAPQAHADPDPPNAKTTRPTTRDDDDSSSSSSTLPNVAEYAAPPDPLASAIRSRLGHAGVAQLNGKDPFLSPAWATLVDVTRPRITRWLVGGAAGRKPGDVTAR